MMTTTVVVIGGGATGMEVLRGLSERGVDAVLVEQGEPDPGTGAAGWKGTRIIDHAQVTAVRHAWNRISGVSARHVVTGERIDVTCDVVVNAAGARAAEIANLAGLCLPGRAPGRDGAADCALRDHARDGVRGLFTVAGGAAAGGRASAEAAADAICHHLGRSAA